MKTYIAKSIEWLTDRFINHALKITAALFILATGATLWHLDKLSTIQIQKTALSNAAVYSETLAVVRTLYTTEVVNTAKKHGMEISHDYKTKSGAIPLPATFSMLLGNRIGGKDFGVKSKLYSNYPFPWREVTGGLADNFAREAWNALQENPKQAFTRFENVEGSLSLRFATADLMREGCIDCHNTHALSPKTDWRVGDLRGVLEVIIPVKGSFALADEMVEQTFIILSIFLIVSLLCITWVTSKLKLRTDEVKAYAETTTNANRILEEEVVVRKQAEEELRKMSHNDSLTGLFNRRHFDEALLLEWKRAVRFRQDVAVIMIDIDDFKLYNDHYGHQTGDDCLRRIAKQIRSTIARETDVVARYGGEEFVAILPITDLQTALGIAEEMRKKVEGLGITHANTKVGNCVTVSAGVASVIPEINHSPEDLLVSADQALYEAKYSGRNCVKSKSDTIVKFRKK